MRITTQPPHILQTFTQPTSLRHSIVSFVSQLSFPYSYSTQQKPTSTILKTKHPNRRESKTRKKEEGKKEKGKNTLSLPHPQTFPINCAIRTQLWASARSSPHPSHNLLQQKKNYSISPQQQRPPAVKHSDTTTTSQTPRDP